MVEEKTKYYIPNIEDLFVGYQCEQFMNIISAGGEIADNKWFPMKLGLSSLRIGDFKADDVLYYKHNPETIRTLYLTKEDIEKEGWKNPEVYRDGGTLLYSKKSKNRSYELTFRGENFMTPSREIIITEVRKMMDRLIRDKIFKGECKSINELRKLQTWLNIS